MRTLLALALILALPALPASADEFDDLIAQLNATRYADREAAARSLHAAGARAVPTLLRHTRHEALEVRRRVAQILGALDWRTPALSAILDRLQRRAAFGDRTPRQIWQGTIRRHPARGEAVTALLACGTAGRARLSRLLRQDGRVTCRLRPSKAVVGVGEPVEVRASAFNVGPGPVWLPLPRPRLQARFHRFTRLQVIILADGSLGAGGGSTDQMGLRRAGKVNSGNRYDPFLGLALLSPARGLAIPKWQGTTRDYGQLAFSVSPRPAVTRPFLGPDDKPTGLTLRVAALPGATATVDVLPPALRGAAVPDTPGRALRLSADGTRLTLAVVNKDERPIRVWNPTTAGLEPVWLAVADAEGRLVRWVRHGELAEHHRFVEANALHVLAGGARLSVPLKMPGLAPGRYRVVAGFGPFGVHRGGSGKQRVWTGEMTSNAVEVEIR